MIFRYLITLRPRTYSLPPSHKVTVDSVMLSNSEKRKATKLLKVDDATVSFFPTSDKIMTYLSKGVCSTVAYLGG